MRRTECVHSGASTGRVQIEYQDDAPAGRSSSVGGPCDAVSFLVPPSLYLERCVESLELIDHQTIRRTVSTQLRVGRMLALLDRPTSHPESGRVEVAPDFHVEALFWAQVPPFVSVPPDTNVGESTGSPDSVVWVPALVIPHRHLASMIDFRIDGQRRSLPSSEVSQALTEAAAARALRLWSTSGPPTANVGSGLVEAEVVDTLARLAIGAVSRTRPDERRFDFRLLRQQANEIVGGGLGDAGDGDMDPRALAQRRRARDRVLRWVEIATNHSIVWVPIDPDSETQVQLRYTVPIAENHTVHRVLELRRHRHVIKLAAKLSKTRPKASVGLSYPGATCRYEGQPESERHALDGGDRRIGLTARGERIQAREVLREASKSLGRHLGLRPEKSEIPIMPWLARTHHVQVGAVPGLLVAGMFPAWRDGVRPDETDHTARLTLHGGGGHLYLEDKQEAHVERAADPLGARGPNRRPNRVLCVMWPNHIGGDLYAVIGAMIAYTMVVVMGLGEQRGIFEDAVRLKGLNDLWVTLAIAVIVGVGTVTMSLFSRMPSHAAATRAFGFQRVVFGSAGVVGLLFGAAVVLDAFQPQADKWDIAVDVLWLWAYVAIVLVATGLAVAWSVRFWLAQLLRGAQGRELRSRPDSMTARILLGLGLIAVVVYVLWWFLVPWPAGTWHAVLPFVVLLAFAGIAFAGASPVMHTAVLFSERDGQRRKRWAQVVSCAAVILQLAALAHVACFAFGGDVGASTVKVTSDPGSVSSGGLRVEEVPRDAVRP